MSGSHAQRKTGRVHGKRLAARRHMRDDVVVGRPARRRRTSATVPPTVTCWIHWSSEDPCGFSRGAAHREVSEDLVVFNELTIELHLLSKLDPEAIDDFLSASFIDASGAQVGIVLRLQQPIEPAHSGGLAGVVQARMQCEHELRRFASVSGGCSAMRFMRSRILDEVAAPPALPMKTRAAIVLARRANARQ